MIRIGAVLKVLGVLLIVLGSLMLSSLPFSFYYGGEDAVALFSSALVTSFTGLGLWYFNKSQQKIGKREGYLIVALGWLSMGIVSMLPYLFSGVLSDFTNAFFESISGLTTTGASVINDIEAVPKGVLFWRSLTQWIGGMGIIVLTIALFPLLGIGGVELFIAEAPGPTSDKIHPRIKETAKRLWLIYVGLTALLTFLLYLCGMNFYDSINRVSLFANKATQQIRLKITGNEIDMRAEDIEMANEGKETLSCNFNGDDLEIGFNARFLKDIISAVDSDEVVLKLSEPNRAGLILPSQNEDNEDITMLIMPMMLGTNA